MAETSKEPSGARKAFGDFAPWPSPSRSSATTERNRADVHLDPEAMATLDAASDPDPAPYTYSAFDSSQRDRTANGPEALGQLVQAHAKGDHLGVHPAR